ncbi:MAG: helix-turn-helix domain-containing protein [Candidatus Pacebacteria bacterium]|nr:helix-turn-helix domain-containing protein [Candidatus Paceibacterota bacterium]
MNDKESLLCGAFLKKMRQEKGWSLEKVSEETKILLSILKDLENDEYENLPPPIYLKGVIKKYANFLKLDKEKVLGFYQKSNGRNLSSGKYDLLPKNRFLTFQSKFLSFFKNIGPKILKYLFWGFILFYFIYEASSFILPAKIILDSPDRDFTTNQAELLIIGKVIRGKRFFIKDQEVSFEENGSFNERIVLAPGINNIQFRAVNILGYETVLVRQIIYTIIE